MFVHKKSKFKFLWVLRFIKMTKNAHMIRPVQFLKKDITENTNSRGKQIRPQVSELLLTTSWIIPGKQVA